MLGDKPELILNEEKAFETLSKASSKVTLLSKQKQAELDKIAKEQNLKRDLQLEIQAEKIREFEENKVWGY
jgi:hypothetical protein